MGATIHEVNYAHGKADFIAKLQISLKECYETEYWIELLSKAKLLDPQTSKLLLDKCGTIRRILVASVNTAKSNLKN
ncbi:MAG: four helix bundle protein [Clostridia bacterium]|nr:four helix bundle protein [Clostridia bacterium]